METCYSPKTVIFCPSQRSLLQRKQVHHSLLQKIQADWTLVSRKHEKHYRIEWREKTYFKIILVKELSVKKKISKMYIELFRNKCICQWQHAITITNSPYAVYLSGSLLTIPMKSLVALVLGKRTLATAMLPTSTNWISLSVVAAFTNSLYSGPWKKISKNVKKYVVYKKTQINYKI